MKPERQIVEVSWHLFKCFKTATLRCKAMSGLYLECNWQLKVDFRPNSSARAATRTIVAK